MPGLPSPQPPTRQFEKQIHPVFTLSLGLLSPSDPSFSGLRKVRKFY
jgi:hypothetical protein